MMSASRRKPTKKAAITYRPYFIYAATVGVIGLLAVILFFALDVDATAFLTAVFHRIAGLTHVIQDHSVAAALIYLAIYITLVSISVPSAMWLSAVGGFCFGIEMGFAYAITAATVGATIVFLLAHYVFKNWMHGSRTAFLKTIKRDFKKGPFNYLVVLRLMPGCPFVLVNLAAATLDVKVWTYAAATFVGILPSTVAQVVISAGLHELVALGKPITVSNLALNPSITAGMVALAFVTASPIIYRWCKK